MSTDLVSWVARRLNESDLDDDAGLVVLSALEGDEELDECLSSGSSPGVADDGADATERSAAVGGVFLESITVEGFRGVGQAAALEFTPTPGLTIVAGRNGSGKSSFAEGLELLLTGGTYRWRQKSAQWRERWRNLHHPDPAAITVELIEESRGRTTLTTAWDAEASDVDNRTVTSQRAGHKREDGVGSLGWERPLDRFRPILSYDELGGLLEGSPSELYDAIANVLGVGQLGDALKRIQTRLKDRKAPGQVAAKDRKELLRRAGELDDERAAEAAALLKKTAPDVGALRSLATGLTVVDRGPLSALRTLASVTEPSPPGDATESARRLRVAVAEMADVRADTSSRQLARLELLERALIVHADHGDMTCPVCHAGELNEVWAEDSRRLVADQRRQLEDLDSARQTLKVALEHARLSLRSRPSALDRAPLPEIDPVVGAARAAWDAWADSPQGSDAHTASALADHLERHAAGLADRLREVRLAASEQLAALDDKWEPLAADIATWCSHWDEWLATKPSADMLARAEKWLKENDLRLKNERLEPIRTGAREAWAQLRQESNVDLGDLTLEGTSTRRRVRIESTVDGEDAGSLAVLSQGELHALALALFLPRATMAESPFRFIVLDDPVQAMDPAKVDGLVELLSHLADTRQVIVLSHDDRLPAAVRRAELGATIVEVIRGKDSHVWVRRVDDPSTRYLSDAFALLKDESLPEVTLRKTLPGILRFAVESAAKDRFFTHRLRAGATLGEVEETWDDAATTRDRVSLAVYDDVRPLDSWAVPPYRKFGLVDVSSAMHNGLKANVHPKDAVHDVRRLVDDVRAGAK